MDRAIERASVAGIVHSEIRALLEDLLIRHAALRTWQAVDADALHTILGPAAASSWLWRLTADERYRDLALELLDYYLARQGRPPRRELAMLVRFRTNSAWNAKEAIEVGSTVPWILLGLGSSLPPAGRQLIVDVTLGAFAALSRRRGMSYYINGNYSIPQCELAFFAGLLARDSQMSDYERSWRLLTDPASLNRRWRGYGWIVDRSPEKSDWSDAEGHFSELPKYAGPAPARTFDAEYTQLQVDRMVRLSLLTRDDRALHHLRALCNRLRRDLSQTSWRIEHSGSTRTTSRPRFFSAGICFLHLQGVLDETELESEQEFVLTQLRSAIVAEYRDTGADPEPYRLRGFGNILLPLLVASSPISSEFPFGDRRALREQLLAP